MRILAKRIPKRISQRLALWREQIQTLLLPKHLRLVRQAGETAMKEYQPLAYEGKITLFRATEQPVGIYEDRYLGWGPMVSGGIEVHDIPGHHGAIIFDPRAKRLATDLENALQKARKEVQDAQDQDPPSDPLAPQDEDQDSPMHATALNRFVKAEEVRKEVRV
jgi:thioesterase domain-containing protein